MHDFKKSAVAEVPKQLRSRGIALQLIAWYTWLHLDQEDLQQPLGFDLVFMPWSLWEIDVLTAVADEIREKASAEGGRFDEYSGTNHPVQHWAC